MFRQTELVLDLLDKEYPDAGTQLNYHTLFQLLVAVVLSAQCTDKQVNRVTPALFAKYPDAFAMAEADIDDLKELIKGVGLFQSKSRHLKQLSQVLVSKYNGKYRIALMNLWNCPEWDGKLLMW